MQIYALISINLKLLVKMSEYLQYYAWYYNLKTNHTNKVVLHNVKQTKSTQISLIIGTENGW